MDEGEARRLVASGEGQRVEFKASFAEQNDGVESLCAFAHADGGTVFVGVKDDGTIVGANLGARTLEGFSNLLRTNTEPQLYPLVEELEIDGKCVIAATVKKAEPNELYHAFKRAYIRVGKTNEVMSSQEQKKRLLAGQDSWRDDHARPRFAASFKGGRHLESAFQPEFRLQQFSGDLMANLRWRIRGTRFRMDWRSASGAALDRTTFTETFNLAGPQMPDDLLELNEIGFEILFNWHGERRSELHHWPLMRRELQQKVLWAIGEEILPPIEQDNPPDETHTQHDHYDYCDQCGMLRCNHCASWYKPIDNKCNICGHWRAQD